MCKRSILLTSLLLTFCMALSCQPVVAQSGGASRSVDLMLVLDNSCSMFPREMIVRGCTSFGSDPNFLRIKGANLFLARLGFGQENEADYQVGVVSLGDEPKLISPLKPLAENRDALARQIASPAPEVATRIVPALEMAYAELRDAQKRKPGNLPAIVLITDGVPYPAQGQSPADIKRLVQAHTDIPLFFMLLKGVDSNLEEFDEYLKFWEELQQFTDHVYVYLIENASQIEETYNTISAILQDTIPSRVVQISPDKEVSFYVSEYTARVILTITYPVGVPVGNVQVFDPRGQLVRDDEPGVAHFLGRDNPVEVISLAAPRLAEEYKNQSWKLKSSWVASVYIDREGAYFLEFLEPHTEATDVRNVYRLKTSQSPRQKLLVRFRLVTESGAIVREAQPIRLDVRLPDGTQTQAPLASDLKPDSEGVYELEFDFRALYPYVGSEFGRFVLIFQAGGQLIEQVPVATARLLVDVGPMPFIQLLNPARLECTPETAAKLTLTVGDFQAVISDTLKVMVTSRVGEVELEGSDGELRGDLTGLCQALLAGLACDETRQEAFQVQVDAQLKGGYPFELITRELPVEVRATACTPLPTATSVGFVLPTPMPTPIPDSDGDGLDDLTDACPQVAAGNLFSGCPTPAWAWLAGIGGLLFVGSGWFSFLWPWIKVRTVAKPPDGYLLICRRDSAEPILVSVREAGVRRRHNRVKIGGDRRKADIVIPGLRAVEFVVIEKDDKILLTEANRGEVRAVFRQLAAEAVKTSNPEIKLWLAAKRSALEKVQCQ